MLKTARFKLYIQYFYKGHRDVETHCRQHQCPHEYYRFNKDCYQWFDIESTWAEAESFCKSEVKKIGVY